MSTPELLPCPFCGNADPSFERLGSPRQSCIVTCGMCGALHESSDEGPRNGSSWNDRPTPPQAEPATVQARSTMFPELSDSELRLMAGEMTRGEMRTLKAVLKGLRARYNADPAPVQAVSTASRSAESDATVLWRRACSAWSNIMAGPNAVLPDDFEARCEVARVAEAAALAASTPATEAEPVEEEPLKWESTTPAYIKYVSDRRYRRFTANVRARYRPICLKCGPLAAPSPSTQPASADDARDAAKYRALATPEIADFIVAIEREALHQRDRWAADGDAGKSDADWFWLIGYLAGKAINKPEKQLHHIITTAAACLNWHGARVGAYTLMRPGHEDGIDGAMGTQPASASAEPPMFAAKVAAEKWADLQRRGYRMQSLTFARSADGFERVGTIDPWGVVKWAASASTEPKPTAPQPGGKAP